MAEPIYEIDETAQYDSAVRKLQDSDPASASGTFNPLVQKILDNAGAIHRATTANSERIDRVGAISMRVTLSPVDWVKTGELFYKTVEIEDIRADLDQEVGPYANDRAKKTEYRECEIEALEPSVDGSITFEATKIPAIEVIAVVLQFGRAVSV